MIKSIAAAVHSVDPEIALAEPRSMDEVRDLVLSNDRFTLVLFVSFAVVALLLAALGVYGVMSFSVAQRSHEIALRMALGANRNRVVALVVREGLAARRHRPGPGPHRCLLRRPRHAEHPLESAKIDLSVFGLVALLLLVRRSDRLPHTSPPRRFGRTHAGFTIRVNWREPGAPVHYLQIVLSISP